MAEPDKLKQLNKSGFPFQLKVEQEVLETKQEHGWVATSREHPWSNPDGNSGGFIDLILSHENLDALYLVLECKRTKTDGGQPLRWLFLQQKADTKPTGRATCLAVAGDDRDGKTSDDLLLWENVILTPPSLESEFCILPNDEPRSPILESLASGVLESLEGLAKEVLKVERAMFKKASRHFLLFPAIVTNAELAVCRFDPSRVKIENGTLDEADVEFQLVPFIRFRKSMATAFPGGPIHGLRSVNKARERTVFVVNAACIQKFLKGWYIEPMDYGGYALQRLLQERRRG